MQISWKSYALAGVASVVLIGAGVVHGRWTDRWAVSAETATAAERLKQVPSRLGDWEGEDLEVKPGAMGAGVAGSLQRRYVNKRLGLSVVVALVCGRPGPVATHTPEVCYGASGYLVGDKKEIAVPEQNPGANFWTSDAKKTTGVIEEKVRIFWAWNGGAGWVPSSDARQEFPRHRFPVLYKLYVLRELTSPGEVGKNEPCEAFLRVLLPALQGALFAG